MKKILLVIALITGSFMTTESKSQVRMNVQVGVGRPVYSGYNRHRGYIRPIVQVVPIVAVGYGGYGGYGAYGGYPVNYGYGYAPHGVAYGRSVNYYNHGRGREYRNEGRREMHSRH